MTRSSPASFMIFFFQKTQSNLEKFDLGQNQSELRFGTEGVLQSAMLRFHGWGVILSWFTFGYQVIFEGVYTLHPAIRKFLDLWIAVVRSFSNLQQISSLVPSSCYIIVNISFEINIFPGTRLVEFIHTLLQEYRETRIVLACLFPRLKSWPLCFHCFSNTLNHILSMLMLVQET